MKKISLIAAVLISGYFYLTGHRAAPDHLSTTAQSLSEDKSDAVPANASDAVIAKSSVSEIANAFANHTSNLQVSGQGVVVKLLPDDNSGSRHQKFIVKLSDGQTLLVAHNIDLAARVTGLNEGDLIEFNGQYEWNERGGVLHWTHRDPNGSHPSGWLQHNGQNYQ